MTVYQFLQPTVMEIDSVQGTIPANGNTVDVVVNLTKQFRNCLILATLNDVPWTATDGMIQVAYTIGAIGNPISITSSITLRIARSLAPASAKVIQVTLVVIGEAQL